MLSEDTLWRLVQDEARLLDDEQEKTIQSASSSEPLYQAPVDLYDATCVEFVALTDAIGVPSQKPTRERAGQARKEKREKRHDTDVMILPRPDGGEQFLCEGMSGRWSLVESARAFLKEQWSGKALSVVAITDGAKTIRSDLSALFGEGVRVILDWYHLAKRVYENLSMICFSKKERKEAEQALLGLLWAGKVSEALCSLSGMAARNQKAKDDLMGYLEKHGVEIIDYGRRQAAGKPIGSGRMEKGVDQVIGMRQKNRGMSWTKKGSRALALLKVAFLNARPLTKTSHGI